MKYLIDGHNLIARLPDVSLADPDDEAKLVRLLARWRWRHGTPAVTVVFDPGDYAVPGRKQTKRSGINVRYAGYSTDADAILIRMIERSRQPAQLTVVSSDRDVQSAAQRKGAQTQSSETFATELTAPPEPDEEAPPAEEVSLSPEEVEAWLKIFRQEQ